MQSRNNVKEFQIYCEKHSKNLIDQKYVWQNLETFTVL